jgi:hypothetical protein
MMKIKKAAQPIKPKEDDGELSKTHNYVDLIDNEAFIFFPQRDSWRKRVILTLDNWSRKEDSLEMQQFLAEYKIPVYTMIGWRKQYEDVAQAFDRAKLAIASRRRIGALKKVYDREVVFKDLHIYDPEWDAVNKYHSALKKEEAAEPTTFNVFMGKPTVIGKKEINEQREDE